MKMMKANNIDTLNQFLEANKLPAKCIDSTKQGCINVFDLELEKNFRLGKLTALSQELMLTLKSFSVPMFKFNLDKGLLQIETLADKMPSVSLINNLNSIIPSQNELNVLLGSSFKNEHISIDLSKNPHMLIGGSTGSGKSVLLHNIVSNLLLASNADLYVVDTKAVEFSFYSTLSHRVKIFTTYEEYKNLLQYLLHIMELRYQFMQYNPIINVFNDSFKPIVLVIDEFADLIMQDQHKECYILLCRLIQKCRASGIYCILATQRPSADIVGGIIKANISARIACKVSSKINSRIILDQGGAENLMNVGEAIINNYKYNLEKFKISFSPIQELKNYLYEKMATYN